MQIDSGYIMELDSAAVVGRVLMKGSDTPQVWYTLYYLWAVFIWPIITTATTDHRGPQHLSGTRSGQRPVLPFSHHGGIEGRRVLDGPSRFFWDYIASFEWIVFSNITNTIPLLTRYVVRGLCEDSNTVCCAENAVSCCCCCCCQAMVVEAVQEELFTQLIPGYWAELPVFTSPAR